jgi:hypothetical protein
MALPHSAYDWFVWAEHGVLRLVMVATGLTLMVFGLALGVAMVMLPIGVLLGLTGVGVLVWGALGELPLEK